MEIEEFVCDDENMMNSTLTSEELNANTSLNRSGLLHLTRSTNEIATQTESNDNLREGSIARILLKLLWQLRVQLQTFPHISQE